MTRLCAKFIEREKSITHGLMGSTRQEIQTAGLSSWISTLKPSLPSPTPVFPTVSWKSPSSHKNLKFSSFPFPHFLFVFCRLHLYWQWADSLKFELSKVNSLNDWSSKFTDWDYWTWAGMFWTFLTPLPIPNLPLVSSPVYFILHFFTRALMHRYDSFSFFFLLKNELQAP